MTWMPLENHGSTLFHYYLSLPSCGWVEILEVLQGSYIVSYIDTVFNSGWGCWRCFPYVASCFFCHWFPWHQPKAANCMCIFSHTHTNKIKPTAPETGKPGFLGYGWALCLCCFFGVWKGSVSQVPPNFNEPLLGLRGMADATFRAASLRQWHLGRCMEIQLSKGHLVDRVDVQKRNKRAVKP